MKIIFRLWTKNDTETIRRILHETWIDSYSSFIPNEDLLGYLDSHYSEIEIIKSLSDPNAMGIITEVDDVPAGCIKLHYNENEKRLYVQQLYILSKYQKLGLGHKLMEFSAERAVLFNLDRVWLGVMIKNEKAVEWYKNMGYVITETAPFVMGKTNVDHYIGFVPIEKIFSKKRKDAESELTKLLRTKTKLIYYPNDTVGVLSKYCKDLLRQQKTEWKWLADGHNALESVNERAIECQNYTVKIQYNPKRIASTTAKTDEKSISERKCFLCLENLPKEQKGILHGTEYLILCNPAPIFSEHFTIIHTCHIPQSIEKSLLPLLMLAKDLYPDFTIFYNGPKGGASAPDHLHFQVTPRRALQVENDAVDMHRREKFYYKDHVAGFTLKDYCRAVIILESTQKEKLHNFLLKLIEVWKTRIQIKDEPIMNILCSYQEELWRIILFLRSKHRPEVYFKDGDDRIVVSPAAVDIGGLIVTPIEKDFHKMNANIIENIFIEVSEKEEIVKQIIGELS